MLHPSAIDPGVGAESDPGPSRYTLDGFVRESRCVEGVAFQSLEPGSVLEVNTRHTCYRLFVLDGTRQRALVTGGSLFPERTEVRVEGATAGGSALKVGWIGVGLRLEMSTGPQRITTSRVQSIVIVAPPAVAIPAAQPLF